MKQCTHIFCIFCLLVAFSSCSSNTRAVLYMAGDNKGELKAVLRHYRDDSEKKAAALYLIDNMADKGEIRYDVSGKTEVIPDVSVITADYLISNIDLAFYAWKNYPWCSHLSFDEFCEEILPYRMRNEPLEEWRSFYFEKYHSIADSLASLDMDMEQVILFFNNNFRKYYKPEMESIRGELSFMDLEEKGGGSCIQMVLNAVQEMRSFGFPLNIDVIPYHGKLNNSHAYNSFIDENGVCHGFNPYSPNLTGNGMTAPIINRICYKKPRYRRVTGQYYDVADIILPEPGLALATFNNGSLKKLLDADISDDTTSSFLGMTKGLLYFPVNQNMSNAGHVSPFILSESGKPEYITAHKEERTVEMNGLHLYWYRVKVDIPEGNYALKGWRNGWKTIAETYTRGGETLDFGIVPEYGLYLLSGEGEFASKQRPFTFMNGEYEFY